jgi:OmcA/MtrC family decaheme c-type cytochrome
LKVEVGFDANGNAKLDPSEVNASSTAFVCNGSGKSSLVKTSPEPGGTNCQFGGLKIESGLDANGNSVLDPAEIVAASTTYACNIAPAGAAYATTGMVAEIKPGGVKTSGSPITVRFTLKDAKGFPVDVNGKYSVNLPIQPRMSLGYYTKDAAGNVLPLKVLTQSTSFVDGGASTAQPTNYNPLGTAPGQGTLVENGLGAGDYTYTFPATTTAPTAGVAGVLGVTYDPTKLGENHVVWVQVSRQTSLVFPTNGNTYYTANYPYYFIPAGGAATPREIILNANCQKCHDNFRLETTTSNGVHGGGRIEGNFCINCHNPDRVSNPAADAKVFIHRIHNGEHIQPANRFHGIEATYPQDIRKCDACHGGAAQGAQANLPTRAACGSCHDGVSFLVTAPLTCTHPPQLDANGIPVPCNHFGLEQADDSKCQLCHKPADVVRYHIPVVRPDPNNSKLVPGGNANTNAGYMAAGGYVPVGAAAITYVIKSTGTWTDTSVVPSVKRPTITFKLQRDAADVVFNPVDLSNTGTTELMPNFVGAPSAYFAFAVPQDGLTTPADFNASASVNLRDAINSKPSTGVLTGPDGTGYYTLKFSNAIVPANATMLTGGMGYTYSLTSTQPLTQTDLPKYPYVPATSQGGLVTTAPDVWKVASGYSGRRDIVDNNNCKNCHGAVGVAPTFHAGQRNDGPTCSFCHTPNRTSSGWSAGSKSFIHAIHAGRKRTMPFMWHATSATGGYGDVGFPSALNDCKVCHKANTYDFTAPASLSAVNNMQLTADATGKFDGTSATAYTLSPYVTADNVTDYGVGFAYSATTGAVTPAGGANLVTSPITSACVSCHDTQPAIDHMTTNGGHFYEPRAATLAGPKEQCLFCHGPGRIAAVGEVHLK